MEVDAPEVAHVDGTLSMLDMSIIDTPFKVGSWQVADFEGLCFVGQVCHAVASRHTRGPIDNISCGAPAWPVTE